jgi:hypothetical protein
VRGLHVGTHPAGLPRDWVGFWQLSSWLLAENLFKLCFLLIVKLESLKRIMTAVLQATHIYLKRCFALNRFVHRDFKPENMLCHEVGNKRYLYLADMGFAATYLTRTGKHLKAFKHHRHKL